MAGRVYHWKHGWIPLDHYAALEKADHKAAIQQVAQHRTLSKAGGYATSVTAEKIEGAPHVQVITQKNIESGLMRNAAIMTVDQPANHLTPAQKREVAPAVESVFQRFPGLHRGLDQEVEGVKGNDSYWGATDAQGRRHRVAVSTALWNDPGQVKMQMADWAESKGAIAGQTRSMKEFRRRVILHEMGHVVHLRARDQFPGIRERTGGERIVALRTGRGVFVQTNPIDEFLNEPVTPRQMGFNQASDPAELDMPVPRFMADTLDRKSAYASGSEMEWYAEAFLDGMVNGDSASESGKRAVALADQLFGKAA